MSSQTKHTEAADAAGAQTGAETPDGAGHHLRQITAPYAFKCGEIEVNVQFSPKGPPLREAVISYLSSLKKST